MISAWILLVTNLLCIGVSIGNTDEHKRAPKEALVKMVTAIVFCLIAGTELYIRG